MTQHNLALALDPFSVLVRTLDGLHFATMHYLLARGQPLHLASYDLRVIAEAQALGFPLANLLAPPPHSITSSACASSSNGMAMPSAFAVFWLIANL